jgi:hypothetical protein
MTVTQEIVEYLLLIDGMPKAFATAESVTAAYVATVGEFTSVCHGLEYPTNLPCSLDLVTGTLSDTSVTLKIEDVDGTLAALFGSSFEDATELLEELLPGDTAQASEFDKHVGTELKGPAGEPRRCSCVPGFNVGMHHFASAQSYTFGLGETPVSDSPLMQPGRRDALYRLVQQADGTWPDLTIEANRAAALCWFGSLLGQGTQDRRNWSIKCSGPESWSMGTLGVGMPKEPIRIETETTLDFQLDEQVLYARLSIYNPETEVYAADFLGPPDLANDYAYSDVLTLPSGTPLTYDDLVAALQSFLADVAAYSYMGAGSFDSFGFSDLRYSVSVDDDGIQVIWDRITYEDSFALGGGPWVVVLRVGACRKVWLGLGYDPGSQQNTLDPLSAPEQFGDFTPGSPVLDRHHGRFWSANGDGMNAIVNGDFTLCDDDDLRNGGGWRRWPPIYPQGSQTLDMGVVGQEVRLLTLDPLYLPGSKAFPLMADPADPTAPFTISSSIGDVTHAGLMAFRGPYRRNGDEDTFKTPDGYAFGVPRERSEGKTTQIARVCWRQSSDGTVALDDGTPGYPRIVIQEWLPPRLYGCDYDSIDGLWASWRNAPEGAQPMTVRPLLAFEHGREGDSLPVVIARLLANTGTAGEWYTDDTLTVPAYGLGGTPVLDVGVNDLGLAGIGDELLGRFTDAESAGLGLAVPSSMIAASMVDDSSLDGAMLDLAADDLYRCKAVIAEPTSARKLFAELLAPTGLCMSLAGGKFGLFDMWTFRPAGSTGFVTSEDYAGEPGSPEALIPTQTLRKLSPIDRVELTARVDVTTGSYARKQTINSTDPGSQYRSQSIPRPINGPHLVHPALVVRGGNWPQSFTPRWDRGFRFWASQHYEAKFPVPAARAGEFWPGAIVSFTDAWVVNPAGVYGVAQAPGFVTSRVLNCKTEIAEVTCMVSAEAMVLYSTAAVLDRYDDNEDGQGYRLFVKDDAFEFRNGTSFDADGFVEPGWSNLGGNALIEGWAFDGVEWTEGIYGEVDSIDTNSPGFTFIKLTGPLTGATLRRDHWHVFVLRNRAEQTAAWVDRVYAALCDKTGFAGGSVGTKWRG